MLEALSRLLFRRRLWVLGATLAAVALAGVAGGGVAAKLKPSGFGDPAAQSTRAAAILRDTFHTGDPNLVLLVTAHHATVDDPAVAAQARALGRRLAAERDVSDVASWWSLGTPALRSRDGRQALVLARVAGDDERLNQRAKQLEAAYRADGPAARVQAGGQIVVSSQANSQVRGDLARAESLSVPLTLLLLVVVFSSAVAGALPLAVGGVAIVGTLLILRVLAALTDVSVYALNLTTALGLGLAIDYSLFIVSRYREQLRAGHAPADALAVTMRTAGRTVLFSAATVAVALLALLVFPLYFLRSMGYAGIAVVALAASGALVVLPALLAVLGRRVDTLRLPLGRRRPAEPGQGGWHRIAAAVMRRPLPIALAVVALLVTLGTPFLRVSFGLPDDRVLPASASSRQVADAVRTGFDGDSAGPLAVVATGIGSADRRSADIDRNAASLSGLPDVARVQARTGTYAGGRHIANASPASARFSTADGTGTWLQIVPSVEPDSPAGEDLVARVRALAAPFPVQVGGPAARLVDTKASLAGHLPQAVAIIAAATFLLLFVFTGSVVIPLKALALNLLSLTAVYGAMVYVFQDGHPASVLGFTPTGTIDTSMPVLMFCIAFGLSMDYEVFLLSRITEEHDRGAGTVGAVATGLERTGRIVTTAAALLAIVFLALATSKVTLLQLLGVGTALAIVVDATLIRALLVPAFMRLAGRANWWAPRPLRRLHARIGLREATPAQAR